MSKIMSTKLILVSIPLLISFIFVLCLRTKLNLERSRELSLIKVIVGSNKPNKFRLEKHASYKHSSLLDPVIVMKKMKCDCIHDTIFFVTYELPQ